MCVSHCLVACNKHHHTEYNAKQKETEHLCGLWYQYSHTFLSSVFSALQKTKQYIKHVKSHVFLT